MFTLKNSDGETVNMKNGAPFTYSSHALADIGRRLLEGELKRKLSIVKK